jgi:hypothetical protein
MPFQPGQSGNPAGRTPGSKNKKTQIAYEEYFSIYQDNIPRLRDELSKLSGKEFVCEMNKMAEFIFPKQSRVQSENISLDEHRIVEVFKIGGKEFVL